MALMCFSTADSDRCSSAAIAAVRAPLRHLGQHVELAWREAVGVESRAHAAGDQRIDDVGVDHRAPGGDLADGVQQLVEVAQTLLQQVRQAARAVAEQLERVVLLEVL